jgi:hypothetical protein
VCARASRGANTHGKRTCSAARVLLLFGFGFCLCAPTARSIFPSSPSPPPHTLARPTPPHTHTLTPQSIAEVFLLCVAGYVLAYAGVVDKATQRKLNVINVSLFTPALLFSKVSARVEARCRIVRDNRRWWTWRLFGAAMLLSSGRGRGCMRMRILNVDCGGQNCTLVLCLIGVVWTLDFGPWPNCGVWAVRCCACSAPFVNANVVRCYDAVVLLFSTTPRLHGAAAIYRSPCLQLRLAWTARASTSCRRQPPSAMSSLDRTVARGRYTIVTQPAPPYPAHTTGRLLPHPLQAL